MKCKMSTFQWPHNAFHIVQFVRNNVWRISCSVTAKIGQAKSLCVAYRLCHNLHKHQANNDWCNPLNGNRLATWKNAYRSISFIQRIRYLFLKYRSLSFIHFLLFCAWQKANRKNSAKPSMPWFVKITNTYFTLWFLMHNIPKILKRISEACKIGWRRQHIYSQQWFIQFVFIVC